MSCSNKGMRRCDCEKKGYEDRGIVELKATQPQRKGRSDGYSIKLGELIDADENGEDTGDSSE